MEHLIAARPLPPAIGRGDKIEGAKAPERMKTSIRDKLAAVQSMRTNELQEALAREKQLSYVICELKKRSGEMEVSRETEREINAQKSFYIIKENECLKKQVQLLERELADARRRYERELLRLQTALNNTQEMLVTDRQISKKREGEREEAVQRLVTNLRLMQAEIVHYESENKRLEATKQALSESKAECESVRAECSLWKEICQHQQWFLLNEREEFVDALRVHELEKKQLWEGTTCAAAKVMAGYAKSVTERMESEVDICFKLKMLMLKDVVSTMKAEQFEEQRKLAAEELKELREKRMALMKLFDNYQLQIEQNQRENCESLALLKSVDDATMAYVLKQRDQEVVDKICLWKGAYLEGDKLLRALLKRYQPFQRGDEKFVSHVIGYLNKGPHVQEPLDIWLD